MKKIKFTGKLSLNKETISKLSNEQMNQVNGGNNAAAMATKAGCTPITFDCPSLRLTGCC